MGTQRLQLVWTTKCWLTVCRICYLPPPKILRVLFSRWHWRRKHHTYILCVALITKAENEICITYVILPQSAVKRSCCMSKPQLHLDTQTDKFAFVNSIHWYLLQNQNCMSHRSKCSWWRALDWTPTAMIKISWKFNDGCIQKGGLGQHCHTSRNSLFPMARGAQLPCMSP